MTRGEGMWLVARCHVMWCDLMCLHFMWCDVLCCVMSRDALRCHVMSSHVMSCHLLWSDAVQWDEILGVCDAMWLVAMSGCVVRSGSVGWIGRWSRDRYYTVLLQYYSVLQSTTPVLLCTNYSRNILYYSSTTLYYNGLHCSTKYYSSTTLYYKVFLQYYSVLQSTTPVLLCTTKYYSVLKSTTPVLQSTTPVLLRATRYYYSSTTPYYKVLLRNTKYYPSIILYYKVLLRNYYKVLLQYYSVLQSTTPVLLCTTKYYSGTTMYYKVLPCPAKYSFALRGALTSPTSPNAVPATQSDSHDWCPSHMKRHLQCVEQQVSYTNVTKYCSCHGKWLASLILVTYETSFTMRGAAGVIHQRHQVLLLPRKMTRIIDPGDIWNVIYNARSSRCHTPTSPSTAPATYNDSHDWCPSHMKRHLQCAEQQASPSNLTKYCACHAKFAFQNLRNNNHCGPKWTDEFHYVKLRANAHSCFSTMRSSVDSRASTGSFVKSYSQQTLLIDRGNLVIWACVTLVPRSNVSWLDSYNKWKKLERAHQEWIKSMKRERYMCNEGGINMIYRARTCV